MIERLAGEAAIGSGGAIAASWPVPSPRRASAGAPKASPGRVRPRDRRLHRPGSWRPTGLCDPAVVADEAEILTLAVLPAARRQGLGSRLVAACLAEAGAAGAARLHLEVGAGNAAARALYVRAGFVEAGRRAGYYRGATGGAIGGATGREDAVIMARDVAHLRRPILTPNGRQTTGIRSLARPFGRR